MAHNLFKRLLRLPFREDYEDEGYDADMDYGGFDPEWADHLAATDPEAAAEYVWGKEVRQ